MPLFAIAGAVVALALVLGIVLGVSRTDSPEADIADLADQGPLLPAGFVARTVPLEPQGSGSVVIPEGSLPEGTQITSSAAELPVLPEGVQGIGQPVTITAGEDPSGPIVIRLPMPEGSYDPSELVIIRVEQDGTTTFLMTSIEGDELVAATPGFSNFLIGLLDPDSHLVIDGPQNLLPGQRAAYLPWVNWARVSAPTWSLTGEATLVYDSDTVAIVQASEESGATATLRYECIDPIKGELWFGAKFIEVVDDLTPSSSDEGEFGVSLVSRTPIVYIGEDVLATAGVYGDFQGPITWEWDLDGTKGSATTGTPITRFELPVQRFDVADKAKLWTVYATDAQGRFSAGHLFIRVLEEPLAVTLDGPERLSNRAGEDWAATYTAASGGSSSSDYLYYFQLLPEGDAVSAKYPDYFDPDFTVIFKQPGEYLLRVDVVEVAADEQDEPRSASAVLPIVVSGGEPLSTGITRLPEEAELGESVSAYVALDGGVLVVSGKKTGYRLKVDWGDGSPSVDEKDVGLAVTSTEGAVVPLSHSYAEPGTYTVKVKATDATGTSAYASRVITVSDLGTGSSPATTTTSEGTSGDSLLRFDGFYRTGGFAVEGESGTLVYYLRFYADGTVISVATTGDPEAVPNWFTRGNVGTNGIVAGTFDVEGDQLSFSLSAAGGTVDYEGVIDGNDLALDWYSNITGAQGHRDYHF